MCFLSRSRALDRFHSRSRKHEGVGGHRDRCATPVESILLPATSILHGDSHREIHALEDAKALHDIFHTPSSIRGYKAARTISRSGPSSKRLISNADAKGQSPARSANSKLGALRHVIKERLSESRLSKASSKKMWKRKRSLDSLGAYNLVNTSFTSTGFTDLLMSRTASGGSYDSDAKDIPTLRLRRFADRGSFGMSLDSPFEALRSQAEPPPENANIASPIEECPPDGAVIFARSQEAFEHDNFDETTSGSGEIQEAKVPEDIKYNENEMAQVEEARSFAPSASQSLSEDCSVHLDDMKISQRLASTSAMPISSVSSSTFNFVAKGDDRVEISLEAARADQHKSSISNSLPLVLHEQHRIAGRYTSFIAQEHNRKPSDPETKRVFEDMADAGKLHPKWKSINGSESMLDGVRRRFSTQGISNPHTVDESEMPSFMYLAHAETIKNANSLAVPGRHDSACLRQRCRSDGQSLNGKGGTWFGENRRREKHSRRDFDDGLALERMQCIGRDSMTNQKPV